MSPRKSLTVCSTPGCAELTQGGRCEICTRKAEQLRGSASSRGYGHAHRVKFRDAVLRKEPSCRLCGEPATVADHWPIDRKELVRQGLDPNDPRHGRGLCGPCHGRQTAQLQPGGWNTR